MSNAKNQPESGKSGREGFLGGFAQLLGQSGERPNRIERRIASELVSGVLSRLEKSKDEIIRLFCRELGIAMAGILKEPLQRLSESRKIQVTIEIVPTLSKPAEKAKAKAADKAKVKATHGKKTGKS
jgi:hypothetical protein